MIKFMTKILALLLLSFNSFATTVTTDIVINKDTTIMASWTIPNTTILRFETGGHITAGTTGLNISGGIIEAAYTQDIFDTLLTVIPYAMYSTNFSACWFGANPSHTGRQNRIAIQVAINTCLSKFPLFLPRGAYTMDTALYIQSLQEGDFVGCNLHFFGESNYWAPEVGSILNFVNRSGNGIAMQQNKGTEIDHINLHGVWTNPVFATDSAFYNCTYANYRDFTVGQYYFGLNIDYRSNHSGSQNGSSGCHFHDMNIGGFTCFITVSLTSINDVSGLNTLNGDALLFENIQGGDGKIFFISSQGQEKGNVLRNMISWGTIHTFFSSGNENQHQGGNYMIDGGNIAGRCNQLFMINQGGWGLITVGGAFFNEQIGRIGTVTSDKPIKFIGITFHFAYPSQTGANHNLLTSNGLQINFDGCSFEYFGGSGGAMNFAGDASSINCYWSNTIVNTTGHMFIYQMPPTGQNFRWKVK